MFIIFAAQINAVKWKGLVYLSFAAQKEEGTDLFIS